LIFEDTLTDNRFTKRLFDTEFTIHDLIMHDLHEANKILKIILDYAQQNKLTKVTKAIIELGSVIEHGDEISPENLEFNILMLARNTVADGLKVEIKKTRGESWILKKIVGV
jgi:Zn finger protein HypA/HybF involved in hydrogenase expression